MTAIHHLIVHGIMQWCTAHSRKKEMTSTGVSALEEMAYLENLPCGTLDRKEQFTLFQVPPVAVQNREFRGRQLGRGVLHQVPIKIVHFRASN